MTASGQAAVMESICTTLEAAFPDMQKPSEQLVYDTLAKLMAEKKVRSSERCEKCACVARRKFLFDLLAYMYKYTCCLPASQLIWEEFKLKSDFLI